jgi:hypothetical protein
MAYNRAVAPGLFRVFGQTFNFTVPPPGVFRGRGIVMAASGTLMRWGGAARGGRGGL